MRLLTTDIYEGAYLLSQGMQLERLLLNGNSSRKTIVFEFTGTDVEILRGKYKDGIATVDVSKLKKSLTELKDIMFNTLRAKEKNYTKETPDPYWHRERRKENAQQYQLIGAGK